MKTKHTPGPWNVDANNCHARQVAVCHGDDDGYAEIWSENWAFENGHRSQFSNARLISAAPNFFEGAKEFIAYEDAMDSCDDISAMLHYANASRIFRLAVVKATGETE